MPSLQEDGITLWHVVENFVPSIFWYHIPWLDVKRMIWPILWYFTVKIILFSMLGRMILLSTPSSLSFLSSTLPFYYLFITFCQIMTYNHMILYLLESNLVLVTLIYPLIVLPPPHSSITYNHTCGQYKSSSESTYNTVSKCAYSTLAWSYVRTLSPSWSAVSVIVPYNSGDSDSNDCK